jgi:hypothetical protein
MHLRWQSLKSYTATPPFTSRVSPGLHAFFTPLDNTPGDLFCSTLHDVVSPDLKCSTTAESATKMPVLSERFAMSASLQFYAYFEHIASIAETLNHMLCGEKQDAYCGNMVDEMTLASYIDVDYDAISQAVVVTAGWPHGHEGEKSWNDEIRLPSKDATVEIGVLSLEGNPDPEDIQFGGFLTVLGQDERPSTFLATPLLCRQQAFGITQLIQVNQSPRDSRLQHATIPSSRLPKTQQQDQIPTH